ncbi:MAG: VWA domain-containing protein, partial [Epsilonproteobacteria bacterium]|nr:VWA domain-containing protein [Campylobacterota bacterium]
MKFLHPEFFLYMLPPLVILFGLLLTQKESQADFFSEEVMDRLRVAANTLTLKARNALFFLAGVFMIVALAEPVMVDGKSTIKQKSADVIIALDISNSMLATDLYPNRLELAKKKAIETIYKMQQNRIGVIAFAKGAYLVSPLSFDHEAVAFLLQNLQTSSITEQGTDFMTLLETTASSSKYSKEKYLLLFSDGGDQKDFSKEIAYAKEHHIMVFVIGMGTTKGAPIRLENGDFMTYKGKIVITKLNEKIAKLATQSGGVYIQATNSSQDIEAMIKEIDASVTKKEIQKKEIEHHIPLFYIPLGLAMVLVLIALSSMSKRSKVHVPSMFIFVLLLYNSPEAQAGLLDFVDIKEAKQLYKQQEYKNAAKKFQEYAKSSQKATGYYDAANAYYRAKNYKEAIKNYEKVHTKDPKLMAKTLHNLGNAYAQTQQYKKAIEAYKEALKFEDDKETKENLEIVKKLLKKKQQKKQNNKNNQNKKQQQNQKNDSQKKKSQNNDNKSSQKDQKQQNS